MQITTKGELVVAALRKIGVASDATLTDIEPQSLEDGVNDLEAMLFGWYEDGKGIITGYQFAPDDTPIDQGDEHGINKSAISAVIYNLALRLAPDYQITPLDKVITTARYEKETVTGRVTPQGQRSQVALSSRIPDWVRQPTGNDERV